MKKTKRIAIKNMPPRFPLCLTLIVYLFYDKFKFDRLWLGIIIFILTIIWIGGIIELIKTKFVDIFEEKE